jgi:hypothetical protein
MVLKAGRAMAHRTHPTTQSTPPDTIETRMLSSEATAPCDSWYTWKGTATDVIMLPKNDTSRPMNRRRKSR